MIPLFADTFYFLALLSPDDASHEAVSEFTAGYNGEIVTTEWVILGLADALSQPQNRQKVVEFVDKLRVDPQVKTIPYETTVFNEGFRLFASRPDKGWSLTDCISFTVMKDLGLAEALTGDHHFVQAGFAACFKC